MAGRFSTESMWIWISVVLALVLMAVIIMLLTGLGPEKAFDMFQGFMSGVAIYMISQVHGILR